MLTVAPATRGRNPGDVWPIPARPYREPRHVGCGCRRRLKALGDFRGDSRFTTWAAKFAIVEAGVKVRKHAGAAAAASSARRVTFRTLQA